MAEPIVNMSEIIEGLSPMISDKISPLITIFKAIGIALLIYIIFLILKALFSWRASHRIKVIAKNVEEINNKMDVLIEKLERKEEKTSEEKKKKSIFKRLFGVSEEKPKAKPVKGKKSK